MLKIRTLFPDTMYFETVLNGRSRSSRIIRYSRQHACNFLLVIHLGPILPRMRDIEVFLFNAKFGVFSLDLQIIDLGDPESKTLW